MYGPELGRRHDINFNRDSNIDAALEEEQRIDVKQFYIYTDKAYMIQPWLKIGNNRVWESPQKIDQKAAMNAARSVVEWTYKDVKKMGKSQDYKRMIKVHKE